MASGGLAGAGSLTIVYPLDYARTRPAPDLVRRAPLDCACVVSCPQASPPASQIPRILTIVGAIFGTFCFWPIVLWLPICRDCKRKKWVSPCEWLFCYGVVVKKGRGKRGGGSGGDPYSNGIVDENGNRVHNNNVEQYRQEQFDRQQEAFQQACE